ncbi:MAG: DUF362 domain-containing protein [Candidatus Bathyarchaeota archaeon]|nr:DUF362 domain-containing protein [Candidatus Bathyarchaeota archaeon]
MTLLQTSREIFQKAALTAKNASKVDCKPLRSNIYAEGRKSLVSLIRTEDREEGVKKALRLIGEMTPLIRNLDENYVLVKPNCNSHDPFPASTHPHTLRVILTLLIKAGLKQEQIIVGDMSGPAWLPTEATMKKNGILNAAKEFGVKVSFFEKEEWVWVKPEKALSWPIGFRIAKTAYDASRIISLPCLKTHQFGGVFTLSLKNSVGMINPADRSILHKKPGFRIAEINLAYTSDLMVLDGLSCFVSGGPAHGKKVVSGVVIAGSDRVAVDTVGVAILKFFKAEGIKGIRVKSHDQLKKAAELGIGHLNADMISLKALNMTDDERFDDMVKFIKRQL